MPHSRPAVTASTTQRVAQRWTWSTTAEAWRKRYATRTRISDSSRISTNQPISRFWLIEFQNTTTSAKAPTMLTSTDCGTCR